MSDEGIVFVATGARFIEEAAANARAARPHLGGRPIAIVTDDVAAARSAGCFDRQLPHPDPRRSYRDKIPALLDPPFERTLYLDADARPISRMDGLFRLLGPHQFAAAHAPVRLPAGWADGEVPETFPELNSGVLLLRREAICRRLMERWLARYDEVGQGWDQATLRSAVWSMLAEGLSLGVLPPEANLRTTKPWVAGKGTPVLIVHGRVPEAEWSPLIEFLNRDVDRFRSSAEWFERQPGSALVPTVAPSRRGILPELEGLEAALAAADRLAGGDATDEPLPCEDPIFILAAGWRSGSTLLQRMLVSDPSVMIWGEPLDRSGIVQGLCEQWMPFTDTWPKPSHQAPLAADEPLADRWIANRSPEVASLRQAHRRFLDRLFGEPARRAGRPRWGLKEVRLDARHAAYLHWLFPGARFLLLVRNPADAWASYRGRGPWFLRWPDSLVEGPVAFGRMWARLASDFHDLSGDAAFRLLRYEDLEAEVASIRAHTGLEVVAAPSSLRVERGQAEVRRPGRPGWWERRRLAAATAGARHVLGYGEHG